MDNKANLSEGRRSDLFTANAAGVYMGMCGRWVSDRVRDGSLPAVRMGRKVFIRKADLDAFLEARVTTNTPKKKGA